MFTIPVYGLQPCYQISPEVCKLLGVTRNKRVAKNAMQAK